MSREIKFRCWNAFSQCMHDWSEMVEKNKIHLLTNKNKSYVCEQYTGLKDKNGVEIYEGDIVRSEQGKHYWMSVISSDSGLGGINLYAMEFCNNVSLSDCGEFYTYQRQLSARRNNIHSRMEVIGNIHQNPELLG